MRKTREKPAQKPEEIKLIRSSFDVPFTILVILLMGIGLVMMFSASYAASYEDYGNSLYIISRQSLFAVAGLGLMFLLSFFNYQYYRVFSIPIFIAAVVFLVLVLFFGTEVNGARRWFDMGFVSFQPSEIAKLAIIICFANMISIYKDKMRTFRYGVLPFVAMLAVVVLLMAKEPHYSGIVIILCIGIVLMFAGGTHIGWFVGGGAAMVPAVWYVVNNVSYVQSRIEIWQNPGLDPSGEGYQILQSLYAIGSGGLFGLGLGKSRQKYLYLPEQHNDFVFAIVCEELGYVGATLVLLLFVLLILRGYWIALKARDRFGSLLVMGVTTLLAIQVFLNMAVVTNLIPVTGVSLPFFSSGGTSLIIQMAEMGIVLSVSRYISAPKSG